MSSRRRRGALGFAAIVVLVLTPVIAPAIAHADPRPPITVQVHGRISHAVCDNETGCRDIRPMSDTKVLAYDWLTFQLKGQATTDAYGDFSMTVTGDTDEYVAYEPVPADHSLDCERYAPTVFDAGSNSIDLKCQPTPADMAVVVGSLVDASGKPASIMAGSLVVATAGDVDDNGYNYVRPDATFRVQVIAGEYDIDIYRGDPFIVCEVGERSLEPGVTDVGAVLCRPVGESNT